MRPIEFPPITRHSTLRPVLVALAIASCFAIQPVYALPTGAQVATGAANLSRSGNTLTVANTPGTIINWSNFSVGALESVRFQQQSALSSVLNRVTGADASAIHGALSSNGRVWLINPNGILFGAGSRIDIPGFIASTLNVNDSDFLAGKLNFNASAVAGSIRNNGVISNTGSGNIYLVAPDITNTGLITAPNGEVLLAAGRQVSLVDNAHPDVQIVVSAPADQAVNLGQIATQNGRVSLFGALLSQKGRISADKVDVDDAGRIVFRGSQVTLDTGSTTNGGHVTVQSSGDTYVKGDVSATNSTGIGGTIEVLGHRVAVMDHANLDASGEAGGGRIVVGGDYQGKNPAIQNSEITYFGPDATLNVDAQKVGAGGTAVVWADDTTRAYGNILARGGRQGGDGGFVEVSGKQHLTYQAHTDARATNGNAGTLLLDPTDIVIGSAATNVSLGGASPNFTFDSGPGNPSQLLASDLSTQLGLGNVVVNTNPGTGGAGNITVSSPVSWSTANTLALNAYGGIVVNANISGPSGSLSLLAGVGAGPGPGISSAGGYLSVNKLEAKSVAMNGAYIDISGGNHIANVAASTNTGDIIISNGIDDITVSGSAIGSTTGISANGNITLQNGAGGNIIVGGNMLSGPGGIALAVTGSGKIALAPAAAVSLSVGAGRTVSLSTAGGNIEQVNAVTIATGSTSLSSASGSINLPNAGNNFNTVSLAGGSMSVRDANALTISSLTTSANSPVTLVAGGDLSLPTSGLSTSGNISLSTAGALAMPSTASITTTAGNVNIDAGTYSCNPCGGLSGASVILKADTISGLGAVNATTKAQITPKTTTRTIDVGAAGGGLSLLSANLSAINAPTVQIGDATHSGGLTVSGAITAANFAANTTQVKLQSSSINVAQSLDVGSRALYLTSGITGISQTVGAGITAQSLDAVSGGGVSLSNASSSVQNLSGSAGDGQNFNFLGGYNGTLHVGNVTTNASGGVSISNLGANGSLGIGTIATASGGSVSLTATKQILDDNPVNANNVTAGSLSLISNSGASTAGTLAISLDSQTSSLSAQVPAGSYGGIDLRNTGALNVIGVSSTGSSESNINLTNNGSITVSGSIIGDATSVQANGGNITVSPGGVVEGYASSSVKSTGNVTVNGGAIKATAPTGNVTVEAGANINVGGNGANSGEIWAGNDVFLKATTGKLFLTSNGTTSAARVTANAPLTAHLNVPSLYFGGYVIDGVEGTSTSVAATKSTVNSNSGIFVAGIGTGFEGIVGSTFLISYGAAPPPPGTTYSVDTLLTSGIATHTYGQAPNAIFGYSLVGGALPSDAISGSATFTPTIGRLTPAGIFIVKYQSGLFSSLNSSFVPGQGLTYTINPALLNLSLTNVVAQNKTYDGNKTAKFSGGALQGIIDSDQVVATLKGNFADRHVGNGKVVTLTGASLSGSAAGNYVLGSLDTTGSYHADITPLTSVAWVGGNGSWSDPLNWADGALPDRNNVLNVSIPVGASVTYDSDTTSLQTLSSGGLFSMAGGELSIGQSLSTAQYSQSGGTLSGAGSFTVSNAFSKNGGLFTMSGPIGVNQASGDLLFTHDAPAQIVSATAPTGKVTIVNTGATVITGSGVQADKDIDITANSPLSIDGPIVGGGDVNLTASYPGQLTFTSAASINAPGNVTLTATGGIVGTIPSGATVNDNSSEAPLPHGSPEQQLNCLLNPTTCNRAPSPESQQIIDSTLNQSGINQRQVIEDISPESIKPVELLAGTGGGAGNPPSDPDDTERSLQGSSGGTGSSQGNTPSTQLQYCN